MEIENHSPQKKPRIPLEDRIEIVHQKRNGQTGSQVSKSLGIPVSTCNTIYKRYLETGSVEDAKQTGRPRQVSQKEEKMLIETTKDHPEMTLTQLMEVSNVCFSKPTAWRTLKDNEFENVTLREKWTMTDEHRKLRLKWALANVDKPDDYWKSIIFTDESLIQNNPNKQTYWVTKDTAVPPIERDRWQVSVLVWGAMSYNGNCILECIDGTMNAIVYLDILKRRLLKNYPALSPNTKKGAGLNRLLYQHDGSKVHDAKLIKDYFAQKEIQVIRKPPKSPDLNPIETIWSQLKSKLKRTYKTRDGLIEDICKNFESIPFLNFDNLYNSMNRRIRAVIEAQGGPTNY